MPPWPYLARRGPCPDTLLSPPKSYEPLLDLAPMLLSDARLFDLGAIGEQLGYLLFPEATQRTMVSPRPTRIGPAPATALTSPFIVARWSWASGSRNSRPAPAA